MTQAVTRYNALYESVRSRRRRVENLRGLDLLAQTAAMKARHARVTIGWLRRQAERIDALAPSLKNHSDAALDLAVDETREVFIRGRQDSEAVRRGLAAVREVARRETGQQAFVVQLMAALALYHGRVVEMITGEGKTLTGSLAAPLLAWRHRHLHVFTVNDYLAARDAESRAPIYRRCGCGVGAIVQSMEPPARYDVYARSIVYGTPKQITADWLRDQLRMGALTTAWAARRLLASGLGGPSAGPMIPGLRAALVDEADAVLIDEGVVPLIIARARHEDEMSAVYRQATEIARRLDEKADYTIDYLRRKADLTRRGRERVAQMCESLDEAIWRAARRAEELVRQSLVARKCYLLGHQYQIVDGQVVIVDEYTGRFLPDRSWEHGLHQAVEAKEGLEITADRETLARVSFQRFFRMYPVLSGMTGTAADASVEIQKVYSRPISVIPTNRPVIRRRLPTRTFVDAESKWRAIVESIEAIHDRGQPILVGTRSIEASEALAARLAARGLRHRVLNANHDKEEADLIAAAGQGGADAVITVATNMAGRGTDIVPDVAACEAGGLHVVLTEMHAARRIDRQFIGRAGRQGDPGSSEVFASLDDELVRLYMPRIGGYLRASWRGKGELAGAARRRILLVVGNAQRRAEARARSQRGSVLRHDDWIDKYLPGA